MPAPAGRSVPAAAREGTIAGPPTSDEEFWREAPGVRRAFAECRFGQIHYRIAQPQRTSQIPVLCFHLSPSSGRMYGRLLAELGADRIAIAPDTPGFGESDAPEAPPEIPDYAAAMGDLLDGMRMESIDIVGYHTGSKIALELARQRPEQVRRVVVISAPIYTAEEREEYSRVYAAKPLENDGGHLTAAWQGQIRWRTADAPDIFTHREIVERLHGGDKSWWGHRAAGNYSHAEALPAVAQPVLILCPEDDLYEQTMRAPVYLTERGSLLEMPDWGGHGMLDMHAMEVAHILRFYLDPPDEDAPPAPTAKPEPARPATPVRRTSRRYVDGPYGQIHLRIAEPETIPDAPPLICFHSSPNAGRMYTAVLTEMGRTRIVVAPDTPGFGESQAPPEPPEIEDYARAMAGVIKTLGFDRVDIMGYHTGSSTCIELARQEPALVRRIIMNSAAIFTDQELVDIKAAYAPEPMNHDGSHLVARWQRMIPFYGPRVPRGILARNYAEGLRGGPMSWWGHRAAFNYLLAEKIPDVTQPILLINPDDDLVKETPRALPLAPNIRMHGLDGLGHAWFDIIPDEMGRIFRGFLDTE